MTNIAVVDTLCQMVAEETGTDVGELLVRALGLEAVVRHVRRERPAG